jgi:hypothetical protein
MYIKTIIKKVVAVAGSGAGCAAAMKLPPMGCLPVWPIGMHVAMAHGYRRSLKSFGVMMHLTVQCHNYHADGDEKKWKG